MKKSSKADSLEIERKKKLPKELRVPKKVFHSVVYFTFTPSLAYYKITPNKNDNTTISGLKTNSIFNSNRLGISFEAGYQRQLTQRLEVYAGLSYYQQHQHITYYVQGVDISSTAGELVYSVTPTQQEKSIDYSMHNLGISSGFFLRIKEGGLQHKIGAGLQYQKGIYNSTDKTSYDNGSSTYLNYQIAYRLELLLNPRMSLYLQPNVTHVIQAKERLKESFSIKPYRAGVSFGFQYGF